VTIPSRTPSWDEIEQFCKVDGWQPDRTTGHVFWRKVLPSGEVLETHRSFAGQKSMSQDVFGVILRTQLRVSRSDFWDALRTGEPVDRPSEEAERPAPSHEAWVVLGLKGQGMTEEEIRQLTPEDAVSLLHEKWSQPRESESRAY
jgi:hypothetical protein